MTKALDEGHRSVLVPETTSVVFEENNGKLILIRYAKYFVCKDKSNEINSFHLIIKKQK